METGKGRIRHGLRGVVTGFALLAAGGAGAVQVITMDRGGSLDQRYAQIEDLRRRGEAVHITGSCLSACTLYLGLTQTCVTPAAQLGFHAPATRLPGIPLTAADFERQTQLMAAHYPVILRDWFLREARYATNSVYMLSGAQLIAMGYPACP